MVLLVLVDPGRSLAIFNFVHLVRVERDGQFDSSCVTNICREPLTCYPSITATYELATNFIWRSFRMGRHLLS